MAQLTPMMQQYLTIHNQVKDAILFFRLGDFYEMFFDDAILASRELEITLTGRDCGLDERAPMCGVPYHSADNYIAKLVEKGYKVAICEQVEDPSQAKGIVKREITRIISPGTITDSNVLDSTKNNYLLCIYYESNGFGFAVTDISTGDFLTSQMKKRDALDWLIDEIGKYNPSEIIVNNQLYKEGSIKNLIEERFQLRLHPYPSKYFNEKQAEELITTQFNVYSLAAVDLDHHILSTKAIGALLRYLEETQKNTLAHINHFVRYDIEEFMLIDLTTRKNLELTQTIRGKEKKGSLLWILDKTITAMGGRLLRQWVEQPLLNKEEIILRLDSVEEIFLNINLRNELEILLKKVYDIQRLLSKISYGSSNGRDLLSLKQSIEILPALKNHLYNCQSVLLKNIYEDLDTLEDVYRIIHNGIIENPPISIREGQLIKDGYHPQVDEYRNITKLTKEWITKIEAEEKAKNGIKTLKVGFNKVFGYYLEVTKSNTHLVPDYFTRKQTLANSERYITPELKELESKIMGAQDTLIKLEYDLFQSIRKEILSHTLRIQSVAKNIAILDAIWSLGTTAYENHYVKPQINDQDSINIEDGRHPVVEQTLNYNEFVPNNCMLDGNENRVMLITGPNMAGKSTYMRQIALIVLMAQIGSFVPAKSANIGMVDRIFTRVGASDDLATGQSTFMVEMSEVSNILKNATSKSLVILDEIGRGTSTFDGLSIAWAVIEYICDKKNIGCKTLFATHYHELTVLEDQLHGVNNYSVAVKEVADSIIFLREIVSGSADQSYGIEVAKLAGLPNEVIKRSKEILEVLEQDNRTNLPEAEIAATLNDDINMRTDEEQFSLFNYKNQEVIEFIKGLSLDEMTPLELMNTINELQQKIHDK